MTTEKKPLPDVMGKQDDQHSPTRSKKVVLLASYGAAVTTLLLACIAFGAVIYHIQGKACSAPAEEPSDAQSKVKETDHTYRLPSGEKVNEKVVDNFGTSVELIKFTSNGPENGSVIALDYKRSLTSIYIPEQDQCYVIGGIDRNISSPFIEEPNQEDDASANPDDDVDDVDDVEEADVDENNAYRYQLADDFPVTDHTILPKEMQGYCLNQEVYWMERVRDNAVSAREKRRIRRRYCYLRRYIRCCRYGFLGGRLRCVRYCWRFRYFCIYF